ncbi:hypothetical protein ATO8_16098 [Roseivivax marinus]|jgi:antibiotic biosynthesis monooxygenase (ABM) superfamily enzyme|uniref:Uncharacterized protein n=1 Tax=Roseivivax marinus TaxID=1379903 RepID=W4HIF7_9RHOB|nr:hypothetical protein [Roseivivax marinus]ETW11785.1 hypothetical protein ATO8_16098 [Roseivivax marinus]UMA65668.1 hypothetical protein LVO79_04175 [Roseivivax marinus]
MSKRQQALFIFLVWLCVYPGVVLLAALVGWLFPDAPVWLRILLSTGVTVPCVSLVVLPWVNKVVAKAQGQSVAELKRAQAKAAERAGS